MRRHRITVGRWMIWTAVLAVNAALVRAFVVQEMFHGVILIFVALEVGLWGLLCTRGRARRFWVGFEVAGVGGVLVLLLYEVFPDSALPRLIMAYLDFAFNFILPRLPVALEWHFDEHQEQFMALLLFAPELAVALLCGTIAALAMRRGLARTSTAPG